MESAGFGLGTRRGDREQGAGEWDLKGTGGVSTPSPELPSSECLGDQACPPLSPPFTRVRAQAQTVR